MPHRADHPTPPHHNMLMRGRSLHGIAGHPPPPHPSISAAYPMHPAEVAAVAAHRARFFAASGLPSYGATSHHPLRHPAAAAVMTEHHHASSSSAAVALAAVQAAQREQLHQRELQEQQQQPSPKKREAPAVREESPEEAAASALLLAANGGSPRAAAAKPQEEPQEDDETQKNPVPVKKRKKHLDFLRRNKDEPEAASAAAAATTATTATTTTTTTSSDNNSTSRLPCHVSPVSTSSVGTHSTAEETVSTSNYATPGSRTSSYDLREGHPLNDEDRMKENMDIEQVVVKTNNNNKGSSTTFPSILHNLLSHSDFAGNVIQWLPHGQAWKVLRWDALRRKVLPKHFAKQLDGGENGSSKAAVSAGSIDSFLSHLKAWGFEEITDGPDVGAYSHPMFLRDDPKLCQQMRNSTPSRPEGDSPKKTDGSITTKSSSYESPQQSHESANKMQQPHSILQVPSLRSDVSSDKAAQNVEPKDTVPLTSALKRNTTYPPVMDAARWSGWGRQHLDPRHYRSEYARYYPGAETSSPMMGHHHHHGPLPSSPSAARPWFPFGSHEQQQQQLRIPQPRVRSTRGGARAAGAVKRDMTSAIPPELTEKKKQMSAFSVSQRGKGHRGGARPVIATSSSHDSKASGTPAQGAVAISKTEVPKVTPGALDEGESQTTVSKES